MSKCIEMHFVHSKYMELYVNIVILCYHLLKYTGLNIMAKSRASFKYRSGANIQCHGFMKNLKQNSKVGSIFLIVQYVNI